MIKKSLWLDPDKRSHSLLLARLGAGKVGANDLRRLALGGLALEMEGKLETMIGRLVGGGGESIDVTDPLVQGGDRRVASEEVGELPKRKAKDIGAGDKPAAPSLSQLVTF